MTVHVIGAGLAGLAASVRLASTGQRVTLYEAAPQAGGRCRSYHDKTLGKVIDNGNHLMLSGNRSLFSYLREIDAVDGLTGPKEARFPFVDLRTGRRWGVQINGGRWTSWLRDPMRAVPGAGLFARLSALRLFFSSKGDTVADRLGDTGALWERFWDPMATAVLNTPPEKASAWLLKEVLRESFALGKHACRPLIAHHSLAASLVDPALAFLADRNAELYFGQRLRELELSRSAVAMHFANLHVVLNPGDQIILALPPSQIAELLPGVRTPRAAHAIVNAHYRLPEPLERSRRTTILGLVGGVAQWIFVRDDIASVTVSAADALAEEPVDVIGKRLWLDVARALKQPPEPLPPFRVIKEKRATFSQTPAALSERPPTATYWSNVYLAGDWVDTGLPATIEGAIRSGHLAAEAVSNDLGDRKRA